MTEQSLAEAFATFEPRQYVRLSGYPEGEETRWHVNKAAQIGAAGTVRHAIILQRADGSEHWIAAVVEAGEGSTEFDTFTAFEGDPPAGMDPGGAGTPLSTDDIDIIGVEDE